MAYEPLEQDKMKNKNFIQIWRDIQITGIKPAVNIITYWSNEREEGESHQMIEFICRGGCFAQIPLKNRHMVDSSSSDESSMAMEKQPRKRGRPQRLLMENDEEAGKCQFHCL